MPTLARALQVQRATGEPGAKGRIFPSECGTHQDAHNVRARLRPAAAAAGVSCATPHVFSHTLATELPHRGVDSVVIARGLGHRNDETTRRVYIHPIEAPRVDDLRSVAGESSLLVFVQRGTGLAEGNSDRGAFGMSGYGVGGESGHGGL